MSYSHNLADEIQVKGLPLSNRKGCAVMISRCCARDQNKLIPTLFLQVPCSHSFPPQISSINPTGFGNGVYKEQESLVFWASPHLLPELPRAILHLKWVQAGCGRQQRALTAVIYWFCLVIHWVGKTQGYWAPAPAPTAALHPPELGVTAV